MAAACGRRRGPATTGVAAATGALAASSSCSGVFTRTRRSRCRTRASTTTSWRAPRTFVARGAGRTSADVQVHPAPGLRAPPQRSMHRARPVRAVRPPRRRADPARPRPQSRRACVAAWRRLQREPGSRGARGGHPRDTRARACRRRRWRRRGCATMGVDARRRARAALRHPLLGGLHRSSLLYGFQRLLGRLTHCRRRFLRHRGNGAPVVRRRPPRRAAQALSYAAADNDVGTNRFSLDGSHADSPRISRERLEERLAAREFGAVIFGSARRGQRRCCQPCASTTRRRASRSCDGGAAWTPLNAASGRMRAFSGPSARASRRRPPTPALASVVFQRELYEAAADARRTAPRRLVPGVADAVEVRLGALRASRESGAAFLQTRGRYVAFYSRSNAQRLGGVACASHAGGSASMRTPAARGRPPAGPARAAHQAARAGRRARRSRRHRDLLPTTRPPRARRRPGGRRAPSSPRAEAAGGSAPSRATSAPPPRR